MKLKYAYLCVECEEVNDLAPRGVCVLCGSKAVFPLARALAVNPAAHLPKRRPSGVDHLDAEPLNGGGH
jgi:hypothetical protein